MTIVQSTGFVLIGKIIAAISAVPELQQLPLVRNPRRAQDLDKGNRLVIVAEAADKMLSKAGERETRVRTFSVGALSRVDGADADADALAEIVSNAVHASISAMRTTSEVTRMAETNVQFHVDDLEVDGAIVVSGWEIQYIRKRLGA